jgi:hypothetical protein
MNTYTEKLYNFVIHHYAKMSLVETLYILRYTTSILRLLHVDFFDHDKFVD